MGELFPKDLRSQQKIVFQLDIPLVLLQYDGLLPVMVKLNALMGEMSKAVNLQFGFCLLFYLWQYFFFYAANFVSFTNILVKN